MSGMGYKDPEWLRREYHDKGKTQSEIAEPLDVTRATISRWLKKHGIESRDSGCAQAEGQYKDKEWLQSKYVDEELSQKEIADIQGVTKPTIKYWIEKHDIEMRDKSEAAKIRAEKHPHTQLSQEDIEKSGNWWNQASQQKRDEFRKWLSQERTGEDNPMYDKTGAEHHNWKEDKPNHRFYQTDAWKEVRREALERADHECEACGAVEQLVGHHVIPMSDGGEPLDADNVCILCRSCHMEWEGNYLRPDTRGEE